MCGEMVTLHRSRQHRNAIAKNRKERRDKRLSDVARSKDGLEEIYTAAPRLRQMEDHLIVLSRKKPLVVEWVPVSVRKGLMPFQDHLARLLHTAAEFVAKWPYGSVTIF